MKLEDQVCSKELAIELHKLGITNPSLFYWEYTGSAKFERWENGEPDYCEDNICAYTVAELGEMLPAKIRVEGMRLYLKIWRNGEENLWSVSYCEFDHGIRHQLFSETEADARAKMLIYLIENKLLTPQK